MLILLCLILYAIFTWTPTKWMIFYQNIYEQLIQNNILQKHIHYQCNLKDINYPWIIANDIDNLHKVLLTLWFLKITKTAIKNEQIHDEALKDIWITLPHLPIILPTISSIKRFIKRSRVSLQEIRKDAVFFSNIISIRTMRENSSLTNFIITGFTNITSNWYTRHFLILITMMRIVTSQIL